MKVKVLCTALMSMALMTGCAESLPKNKAPAEATQAQVPMKQSEPMGIPIELEKTSIRPFIALLGNPIQQAKNGDDHVVVMYVSNRLAQGRQNNVPMVVVLPEDDKRILTWTQKILLLDLKKTENDWVVVGIRMGEAKTTDAKPNAKEAKPQANSK